MSAMRSKRRPGAARWTLVLLAAVFVLFSTPGQAADLTPGGTNDTLSLGIPGNAPFTGLTGTRVTGVIAETTIAALEAMGWRVAPRRLPFKRMYKWVHTGRLDVALSVLRTPERAELAHYSAPIVTEYTVIMVPKGRTFPLRRVTDLEGRKIGGQLGFQYPQIDGTGVKLILEKDYDTNIRKIAEGKLDGALIGSITGPFLVQRLGLSDQIEFLLSALGAGPLGAAFSKSALTNDQLAEFDAAIEDILAGPRWHEILFANGTGDLVKEWPIVPK